MASRTAMRSAGLVKASVRAPIRTAGRQIRQSSHPTHTPPQSGISSSTSGASSSGSGAGANAAQTGSSGLVGGIAGGALVFALGYGYYSYSGAKTIVDTASSTKKKFAEITQTMKEKAPEPNEALKWFRQTATSYAAFIPGGKHYVDAAFNDLDKIEQKHRGELDKIVKNAYSDMQEATKSGLTMETAAKTWEILQKYMAQIGELAGEASGEILDNHPELKEKVGGNIDELKRLAKQYGPEAQKELDRTYDQIKDIVAGGVGVDAIAKVKKIVEEKMEKIQSLGDEAWKKGMEEAKPYLEKSPEIKKLVEENADKLKKGNFKELYEKIKAGDMGDLESYVKQAGEKAANSGVGKNVQEYIKMIPGGSEIIPKLQKLQQVAEKRGDEAEKIMKDTYKEISEILSKKADDVEQLAEKAKKDAKK